MKANISIFYSIPDSGPLLKALAGILKQNSQVDHYWLSLNYNRGPNICLHFEPGEAIVAEQLKEKITAFLQQNPSPGTLPQFPLKSFLMDFPVNSIQFNIVKNQLEIRTAGEFQEQLSDFMMEILSDDIIDEETIFSFSLYCAIGMHAAGITAFKEVAGRLGNSEPSEIARQIYAENYEVLAAAVQEDGWLYRWTNFISRMAAENKAGEEELLYHFFYFLQHQLSLSTDTLLSVIHIAQLMSMDPANTTR